MPPSDVISPALRAKLLRAYLLRCQGLTYRQIGQRMRCAHSTVGRYLRAFHQRRQEITESLAEDQLLAVLEQLDQHEDSGHEGRIHAARELRLLLDALDRITDRRQRRQRRVEENHAADQVRLIEELGELVQELSSQGLPPLDLDQLDPAERSDLLALHRLVGRPLAPAAAPDTPEPARPEPSTVVQAATTAEHTATAANQNRTESTTIEPESTAIDQESERSPAHSSKSPDDPQEIVPYLASTSPSPVTHRPRSITGGAYATLREHQRNFPTARR